ncbi:MAG TPA: WYL domain-containing protein, partial [Acidimicrobiales bacterium]|nr:WYL domain-containing protein [Acidimicrobiales bacterium]
LTGLTPDEAEALALAGLPGPAADLGLGTVLTAAQLKVDAALPPELRRRAARVRDRFHLDLPGWFARDESVPHLATLARGVWEEKRAEIRYTRADNVVRRTLDPLGLVLKAGRWYLVAGAGRQHRPRTYRVSRVSSAKLRDEPVIRPDGFDLVDYWTTSADEFARSMLHHEVSVRVRADRLNRLRHAIDPTSAALALESATEPDADGWVALVVPTESLDYAHDDLLRLGPDVEVLAPVELRERLAATARALAARYEPAVGPAAPTVG